MMSSVRSACSIFEGDSAIQPPVLRISCMTRELKATCRVIAARLFTPVGTARPSISGPMMLLSSTKITVLDVYFCGNTMPMASAAKAMPANIPISSGVRLRPSSMAIGMTWASGEGSLPPCHLSGRFIVTARVPAR
jgi:hypothetical protein